MDPLGKRELLSFYDKHLKDFGDTPYAVRWTPDGQRRRYEMFFTIAGDLVNKSILDFGCGKGDFYGFLQEKGITPEYCGIDINENLICLAREKYPEGEFIVMDLEEAEFNRFFDIVFICGVFNLRTANVEESMKNVLKKLFRLCRDALHINFLSDFTAKRDVELYYVNPDEMLRFIVTELSPKVVLRHGLVKEDVFFSIYCN